MLRYLALLMLVIPVAPSPPPSKAEVRERYHRDVADSRLVIWTDESAGLAGVRAGIDEVTWSLTPGFHFELAFSRPAKGSGYLELSYAGQGGVIPIAAASVFDDRHLQWFRTALQGLHNVTGAPVQETDMGHDA
jgi:hypothetical protein